VLAAVDRLRRAAADNLQLAGLREIQARGGNHVVINLLVGASADFFARGYNALVRTAFAEISIEDLRAAEVHLKVSFAARDASCPVADGSVLHRTFAVADVTVKAHIVTRWVDMWSESEKRLEWAVEDVSSIH
jgi:hypothetical protein